MKLFTCPQFRIGFGVRETERWACLLTREAVTHIPVTGRELVFRSGEQVLGRLSAEGRLEISQWYACDGYSPTIPMFGRWLRITPTPKKAGLFPAIFHDFTRQFCEVDGCPWTRQDSDTWFYNVLISGGESKTLAGTYYGAVSRAIGNLWYRFRKHDPTLTVSEK